MIASNMKQVKMIYKITIDKPYINIKRGIVSKLTFKPKDGEPIISTRKTAYQPAERALFKAAMIELEEDIIPKVSEGRSLEINDIPLSKISDDTFTFNVFCEVPEDASEESMTQRIGEEAEIAYKAIERGLADDENGYQILRVRKTICKSDTCEEDSAPHPKQKTKKLHEFQEI